MGSVDPTMVRLDPYLENTHIASWVLTAADTGNPVQMPGSCIRSVQIAGTFDSATVVVQGSNDGTNYVTLTDPQGNTITKTSAAIEAIEEVTRYIRASSSGGGANTSVTVTLLLRRNQ